MIQVLRDGKVASCQSAVARISSYLARSGMRIPDSNTGDYCKARAQLSEAAVHDLCCEFASTTEGNADSSWHWKDKTTYLIDGFTCQMPDTIKNQKAYPQHTAQKPRLGFPIARCAGLISLATGCLVNAAMGRFKGKGTGETALFTRLFGNLKPGDVVVAVTAPSIVQRNHRADQGAVALHSVEPFSEPHPEQLTAYEVNSPLSAKYLIRSQSFLG